MKKKYIIIIILITILLTLVCAEELNEYKIGGTSYIVKLMDTWELLVNSTRENNVSFLLMQRIQITKNGKKIFPTVLIAVEKIDTSFFTEDIDKDNETLWFYRQLSALTEMSKKGKKIKDLKVDIPNLIIEKTNLKQKFKRYGSFCIEFTDKDQEDTFLGIQIFFINNNDLISINFDCTPEIYNDLENEIIYIVNNFKL